MVQRLESDLDSFHEPLTCTDDRFAPAGSKYRGASWVVAPKKSGAGATGSTASEEDIEGAVQCREQEEETYIYV
eukprot:6301496-Ditylum_brightwellii.AAC.1